MSLRPILQTAVNAHRHHLRDQKGERGAFSMVLVPEITI